ncbi:hypothetical protein BB560_000690 [Smittium megazygosporum]|uniref:B box-type domain-containing protein n=1 Tax=Smittium megazygosporum TaxID=133381 RepID=A0A2T9ZJK0_9FUNG|nr:hypothetical protein BB560_000690 [Smittium megazygosporum]
MAESLRYGGDICRIHDSYKLEFYCHECSAGLCELCLQLNKKEKHKNHSISPLAIEYDKIYDLVDEQLESALVVSDELASNLENLKQNSITLDHSYIQTLKLIEAMKTKVLEKTDNQYKSLQSDCLEYEQQLVQDCERLHRLIDESQTQMEDFSRIGAVVSGPGIIKALKSEAEECSSNSQTMFLDTRHILKHVKPIPTNLSFCVENINRLGRELYHLKVEKIIDLFGAFLKIVVYKSRKENGISVILMDIFFLSEYLPTDIDSSSSDTLLSAIDDYLMTEISLDCIIQVSKPDLSIFSYDYEELNDLPIVTIPYDFSKPWKFGESHQIELCELDDSTQSIFHHYPSLEYINITVDVSPYSFEDKSILQEIQIFFLKNQLESLPNSTPTQPQSISSGKSLKCTESPPPKFFSKKSSPKWAKCISTQSNTDFETQQSFVSNKLSSRFKAFSDSNKYDLDYSSPNQFTNSESYYRMDNRNISPSRRLSPGFVASSSPSLKQPIRLNINTELFQSNSQKNSAKENYSDFSDTENSGGIDKKGRILQEKISDITYRFTRLELLTNTIVNSSSSFDAISTLNQKPESVSVLSEPSTNEICTSSSDQLTNKSAMNDSDKSDGVDQKELSQSLIKNDEYVKPEGYLSVEPKDDYKHFSSLPTLNSYNSPLPMIKGCLKTPTTADRNISLLKADSQKVLTPKTVAFNLNNLSVKSDSCSETTDSFHTMQSDLDYDGTNDSDDLPISKLFNLEGSTLGSDLNSQLSPIDSPSIQPNKPSVYISNFNTSINLDTLKPKSASASGVLKVGRSYRVSLISDKGLAQLDSAPAASSKPSRKSKFKSPNKNSNIQFASPDRFYKKQSTFTPKLVENIDFNRFLKKNINKLKDLGSALI